MPTDALATLDLMDELQARGKLNMPATLTIRIGGKWPEIIGRAWREPGDDTEEPAWPSAVAPGDDLAPF